jgi:hypothetical protein
MFIQLYAKKPLIFLYGILPASLFCYPNCEIIKMKQALSISIGSSTRNKFADSPAFLARRSGLNALAQMAI